MITRAIINKVDNELNKLRVRIPIYDGAQNDTRSTADEDLSWACIMCLPGLRVDYLVGDIVIVGFEDDDRGKPIVLGHLVLTDALPFSTLSGVFDNLSSTESFLAPTNTTIGKTPYSQLFNVVDKT